MAANLPKKRPLEEETEFPTPNLLGPPYRWLLPDCRCFYSESIYVKACCGEKIDRYFKLPNLDVAEQEFWEINADVSEDLKDKTREVKAGVYQ